MMPPEIQIQNVSSEDSSWDEYVKSHPHATFFHLNGWRRVLEKTFPYRSFSFQARIGGKITGVLPLFLVRNLPRGHSLVSSPLGVYGGICADDDQSSQALLSHAQTVARQLNVRFMELRNQAIVGDFPVKDLYVTFRREIFNDPEKNFEAIPRKQRRMIRQGEKNNLTTHVGGMEYLKDFYLVYSQSVRNLGTPVFPLQLFENLLQEFGEACRILAVFHKGRMVAAVMTFFFRDQVMPYYGGALRDALQYAANDFMYWKLLSYGAEHGYKVFDFGRSKVDSGPYHFKRHWGFEPTPLPYQYCLVTQKTLPDMSPRNPKYSVAIQVWKKLPLGLSQWLGPKIVRFFP